MKQEQVFKDQLRKNGERVTTARLGVYRVLSRYSPISMPKLLEKVQLDGIDPVTCYRTLDLFRRLGFVQDVGLGRNRLIELTDGSHAHHHHIWCQNCGKVIDFDSAVIEDELARISEKLGVSITSHQLEAYGVCRDCAKLP